MDGAHDRAGRPAVSPAELPPPWRQARVAVVLPTYNEAANLPKLVDALFSLPLPNLRVLVVDDDSPDGTGEVAEELAAGAADDLDGRARMAVVYRAGKEGLGRAYVDGMTRALDGGADYVVQMDADLSHPPERSEERRVGKECRSRWSPY